MKRGLIIICFFTVMAILLIEGVSALTCSGETWGFRICPTNYCLIGCSEYTDVRCVGGVTSGYCGYISEGTYRNWKKIGDACSWNPADKITYSGWLCNATLAYRIKTTQICLSCGTEGPSCGSYGTATTFAEYNSAYNYLCTPKPIITGPTECYQNKTCGNFSVSTSLTGAVWYQFWWDIYFESGKSARNYIDNVLGFKSWVEYPSGYDATNPIIAPLLNLNTPLPPWINSTENPKKITLWVRGYKDGVNYDWSNAFYINISVYTPPAEASICGNGSIEEGFETCDDENNLSNDGCDSNCQIEAGWNCIGTPSICCEDECSAGESSCDNLKETLCSLNQETGCYEWSNEKDCEPDEVCDAGQCMKVGSQPVSFCSDYKDSDECESDDYGICEDDVNSYLKDFAAYAPEQFPEEGFCDTQYPITPDKIETPYGSCNYYAEDCKCDWDDDVSLCAIGFNIVLGDCDNPLGNGQGGNCTFVTSEVDECEKTGFRILKRTASWTGTVSPLEGVCVSHERKIPCVSTAKLPFFTLINFAVTFCLIIIIYGIYFIKKGKK